MHEIPAGGINVQDNNHLRLMDEVSVRSINGCRVTDKILRIVEGACTSADGFRTALRFLKVC